MIRVNQPPRERQWPEAKPLHRQRTALARSKTRHDPASVTDLNGLTFNDYLARGQDPGVPIRTS